MESGGEGRRPPPIWYDHTYIMFCVATTKNVLYLVIWDIKDTCSCRYLFHEIPGRWHLRYHFKCQIIWEEGGGVNPPFWNFWDVFNSILYFSTFVQIPVPWRETRNGNLCKSVQVLCSFKEDTLKKGVFLEAWKWYKIETKNKKKVCVSSLIKSAHLLFVYFIRRCCWHTYVFMFLWT